MVVVRSTNNTERICIGTIISDYKIVTPAQCVANKKSFKVNFGIINESKPNYTVTVPLNHVTKNSKYDSAQKAYDLAVIEIEHKIQFNAKVGKMKLINKTSQVLSIGAEVIMLGYIKGSSTNNLQSFKSIVMDFSKCERLYWNRASIRLNRDTHFCVDLCDGVICSNKAETGG